MKVLFFSLVFLFCVFAILAVILLFLMPLNRETKRYNKVIEKNISILKSKETPRAKSLAFVNLIKCSYVLIHVLVNNGNKYDDEKQTKQFCSSLSPEYINKVKALEAICEKRTTRL